MGLRLKISRLGFVERKKMCFAFKNMLDITVGLPNVSLDGGMTLLE